MVVCQCNLKKIVFKNYKKLINTIIPMTDAGNKTKLTKFNIFIFFNPFNFFNTSLFFLKNIVLYMKFIIVNTTAIINEI